jgi:hypothetical protein
MSVLIDVVNSPRLYSSFDHGNIMIDQKSMLNVLIGSRRVKVSQPWPYFSHRRFRIAIRTRHRIQPTVADLKATYLLP